ncbi:MAG TPA: Gfo/Idh/MocA family oxidoreductase [Kineosporiaceae bacterium]|nr:Gfo/Idh/MocA family oxidoreductase [Kineosporiaceae bacterium]
MSVVRWGMLSTAAIGRVVAEATRRSAEVELVAVASRDAGRARAYADELGLPHSFGSYDALLASDEVDAVYVSLPVSMHTDWTLRALRAGKHVLCEKPFATTAADAARCFYAALAADRQCIEGLMYRHHPQTLLAQQLVAQGAIGVLTSVRAALSVSAPPGDIRRTAATGGGALADLGCYCVSAIRLFAGEPIRVHAERVPDGEADVDLRFAATLALPGHVLGQFDVGLDMPRRDELELIGTGGKITVPDPWLCRAGTITLVRDGIAEVLPVDPTGACRLDDPEHDAYRLEFEAASAAVLHGIPTRFGRQDAVAQAGALEALLASSLQARPVTVSATPVPPCPP